MITISEEALSAVFLTHQRIEGRHGIYSCSCGYSKPGTSFVEHVVKEAKHAQKKLGYAKRSRQNPDLWMNRFGQLGTKPDPSSPSIRL